jgi:prepilin-type N-terminal cleavage/methylation domain-containing protein
MKRGFTLIELMIVIIIIAVLALLAMTQYEPVIERARSAEAKDTLGYLRKMCLTFYARDHNILKCTPEALSIGTEEGMVPPDCYHSHYFNYSAEESPSFENVMVFTATRCMKAGRPPDAKHPGSISLTVNFENNTDEWSSRGVY